MQIILKEKNKELLQPVRRYDNQRDKAAQFKKLATVKIGQKNKAVKILERKQLIKDQVAQFNLIQEKQLRALEERKEELVKDILSFCEENKDSFKSLKGVSAKADKLLSGDINYVLCKMNAQEVGKEFDNLANAFATDIIDKLKEFYESDFSKDKKNTFEDYLKVNGDYDTLEKLASIKNENGELDLNKVPNEKKQVCKLLDTLNKMYTKLFAINDKINDFKKESKQRLELFNQELDFLDERLNANNDSIQLIKKINKKLSKINKLV